MTIRRLYVPKERFGETIELAEDQARHLSKVLRLVPGDEVRIFDGEGREFDAEIKQIKGNNAIVEIIREVTPTAPESELEITLGIPTIKTSNAELIVKKAVELGITTAVPFISKRSGPVSGAWNRDRWERIIIESSKQCGRATLMKLTEPKEFRQFVSETVGERLLFSELSGSQLPKQIDTNVLTAITGPEGGWEVDEVNYAAERGFSIVHFSGRILRAETAAISVAAILQHRYGDMN